MSQQLIVPKTRSIRFVACGGTGINILRRHRENQTLENSDIRAQEFFSYIDTSVANLHNVNAEEVFVLKDVDGSGKNRPANAAAIKAAIPSIMLQQPACDLNVVIFSAGGGTGSTAGPMILEQLLAEGHAAVAIVIGCHESLKATTNTISTLQGLEIAVQRLGRPIVMHYKENDRNKSNAENDIVPQFVMGMLSVLASGKNAHLDMSDIRNFFDFHKVTHHQPCLAMLDVFAREEDVISEIGHAVTFAALMKDPDSIVPAVQTDYDTVGYLPETTSLHQKSFYFTVTVERLSAVFKTLLEKKAQADKQRQITSSTTSLLGGNIQADDLGLVFD